MSGLKRTKFFPLSDEELQKLSESESGIVLRENCPCHVKLNYSALPVNSDAFISAIKEELNKRVLKFNSSLNDMILRYKKIRFARLIEATRCRKLTVACTADIYVFKPQCENILTAIVNKKSKNHIGCLMYNVFNVSIIKPPDLPFDHWPGRHIEVNDTITFKVVKVDVTETIPYIIGELETDDSIEKDSGTGTDRNSLASEDFSDLDVLDTVKPKKAKKRIEKDSGTGTGRNSLASEDFSDLDVLETVKPKKAKKRIEKDSDTGTNHNSLASEGLSDLHVLEPVKPKKAKKRKHSYEETSTTKKRKYT